MRTSFKLAGCGKDLVEAHRQADRLPHQRRINILQGSVGQAFSPMSLGFPKIANPAQIVGRTPGPRGSPWTRFSPTESASSAQGKPTRASAADQGVRPTINADCPILTKPSGIGHSACHVVFPQLASITSLSNV